MSVLGGLALFLFGIDQLTDSLKTIAGSRMRSVLARMTTGRFKAAFAGAFVTSVIQSSTVTTVLLVGFVSAGLMTLSQSVGVIMGANIGSTVTAQIVAFKITHFALIPLAAGFAIQSMARHSALGSYGRLIMGIGMIFFGMQLMSDGTSPLREYEPFIEALKKMESPLLAIAVSTLFTAIVQSSAATTGIIIVLASQGFLSLETSIALVFGANIGTCVTALFAAIGRPRDAVRTAVVHVLFNVAGVLIWFFLIDELAWISRAISPHVDVGEVGDAAARVIADTPRQVANAHTIFNVANTALLIWFTGPIASLAKIIVPDRREASNRTYLDDLLLSTPSLALHMIRLELGRLGAAVFWMVREGFETAVSGSEPALAALRKKDYEIEIMHEAIIRYLGMLSRESLSGSMTAQLQEGMATANYLQNIGEMIETNIYFAATTRLKHEVKVSAPTKEILRNLHQKVAWSVERSVEAMVTNDKAIALEVIEAKSAINELVSRAEDHIATRLIADEPNRFATFKVESDFIESLKRIYYFSKRISKIIYEENGKDDPADEFDAASAASR